MAAGHIWITATVITNQLIFSLFFFLSLSYISEAVVRRVIAALVLARVPAPALVPARDRSIADHARAPLTAARVPVPAHVPARLTAARAPSR